MTEEFISQDNRLHIRLKRHIVKHGKRLHTHIKKHHRKYLFWSTLYGISHILVVKVLALKLLFLKSFIGGLTLIGIANPSLTDIFAKMDNVCINNTPIIAQQLCEKNFASIQDAVNYLESMIDPETDTIYNAQYYGIIKSMLGDYCGNKIDQNAVAAQTSTIDTIEKSNDIGERIRTIKAIHDQWKSKSLESNFSGEEEFCTQKYLAYDMLDLSKNLFLKELKDIGGLNPHAILSWQKLSKASDNLIINNFFSRIQNDDNLDIPYTLHTLGSSSADIMANIIKNISVNASNDAFQSLGSMNLLSNSDIQTIKDKLEVRFVSSCDKNRWYHTINQYVDDNNVVQKTTLEELKLDIWLCDSYQYIDQLEVQVQKLLIHEIGHYLYYFKDTSTKQFESICRNMSGTIKVNNCDSREFVSNYAQTSAEEDYAESFSRWANTKINQDKQYLFYYRKESLLSTWASQVWSGAEVHLSASDISALAQKFNYFDTLLQR